MNNNLVKSVAKTFDISLVELAKRYDIAYSTLKRWSSDSSKMPPMAKLAFTLLLENHKLSLALKSMQNIIKEDVK